MVFAVAHRHRAFLDDDVVRSHVEDHADLSPFLWDTEGLRRTLGDVAKAQHFTGAFQVKVSLERHHITAVRRSVILNIICPENCVAPFDLCFTQKHSILAS